MNFPLPPLFKSLRMRLLLIMAGALVLALLVVGLQALESASRFVVQDNELQIISPDGRIQTFETETVEDGGMGSLTRSIWGAAVVVGLVTLVLVVLLVFRSLQPISALTTAARAMAAGDYRQHVEPVGSDEIGDLTKAFNQMASELAESSRRRQNLMSDVAHELRSPLTNIQCQIEAIQDGLLEPSADVLAGLHHEAVGLTQLIDDLQVIALADAGELPIDIRPLDLSLLSARIVEIMATRAESAGATLRITCPEAPITAMADELRLTQVIRNLLDNALCYSPQTGTIDIILTERSDAHRITVRDQGPGIAAEQLDHIFDRFFRVDSSRSRATGGTGLGLAIAHRFVALHGGMLTAENGPDGGMAFHIDLPRS